MDMKVNIAGVEWKNPVTVASGTFGSGEEFSEFVDLNRLGAVTTKGVANVPWPGNPTPRVAEVYGGMMNAIGLQNPGIDLFCKRDIPFLKKYDTKIIVNVCGHAPEEYLAVVERLADEPIDMMEINISCPNVNAGFLAFGQDAHNVEKLTAQIKKIAKQPIIMKLTPNVTDITEIEIHWLTGDVYLVESNADGVAFQEDYTGDNEDYRMRYRVSNGKLIIQPCKSRLFSNMDLPRKALTVFLPDTLTLDNITVETVSANVELMGGSVDSLTVSTTSGNITGPGLLAEDYDFGTVSGDISLTALPADGSDIDCETVSGEARISCTAAPDEVSFNSVSGDLRLTLPEGSCRYTLDLSTVSGDRDTDGFLSSGDKLCAITAETVSGDVELRTGP